jgi:hypothetical protein
MKKITIFIIALFCISIAAPAFAIETSYKQSGYYEIFIQAAIEKAKQKGMFVQSRDGRHQAIVPKAEKEKTAEQQKTEDQTITK